MKDMKNIPKENTQQSPTTNDKAFLGMLGICAKAGAAASGAFAAEKAIKSGTAKLVIVARDASENTRTDYGKLCNGYKVRMLIMLDKEQLGKAVGKDERTIVAITDEGLSQNLLKKMNCSKE